MGEVDLVIYLRTNPEVARDRVMSRNREEEVEIPKSFFQRMHQLHEDWLIHGNSSSKVTAPQVLLINADVDISILSTTYENLAALVWNTFAQGTEAQQEHGELSLGKFKILGFCNIV